MSEKIEITLKKLDDDFHLNEGEVSEKKSLFSSAFIIIITTIIGVDLFFLADMTDYGTAKKITLWSLGLITIILQCLLVKITISSFLNINKLEKKYGKNRSERLAKIKKTVKEISNIEEIIEYYSSASHYFREKVLDEIVKEEIAKELNIEDNFNTIQLMKSIKNKNAIKIKNE